MFQPSKKRKMPFRAHGVSTCVLIESRLRTIWWSQSAKKNVRLRTIGPPKLTVYWFRLIQSAGVGLQSPVSGSVSLLLPQVLESMALFRSDQTALPRYSFVPERVVIRNVPFPRPSSASTGAVITLTSAIMSGLV